MKSDVITQSYTTSSIFNNNVNVTVFLFRRQAHAAELLLMNLSATDETFLMMTLK
jgi:hypothetical protein